MSYAIIGFGNVGQALARAFARKGLEVAVATSKSPDTLASAAMSIGPTIVPKFLTEALEAEVVLLAVPYWSHRDVAKAVPSWEGKIVIDVTNAFKVPVDDLDGLPSSAVIAAAMPGAKLVRAFNHIPARTIAADPAVGNGRRVVFVSSDDDGAADQVSVLAKQLGFAPVALGALAEGGALVQARGSNWAPLMFQDLFKNDA